MCILLLVEECLSEEARQHRKHPLIGHKEVVRVTQLPLLFKLEVLLAQLLDSNDLCNMPRVSLKRGFQLYEALYRQLTRSCQRGATTMSDWHTFVTVLMFFFATRSLYSR